MLIIGEGGGGGLSLSLSPGKNDRIIFPRSSRKNLRIIEGCRVRQFPRTRKITISTIHAISNGQLFKDAPPDPVEIGHFLAVRSVCSALVVVGAWRAKIQSPPS